MPEAEFAIGILVDSALPPRIAIERTSIGSARPNENARHPPRVPGRKGTACTPTATGVCWQCEAKHRAVGGDNPVVVLAHPAGCADCRELFLNLGRTAEAADMENAYAVSLAAIA
jgi:hypothetical protein